MQRHMKNTVVFLPLFTVALWAAPALSRAADPDPANDEQQIRKIEQGWLHAIVRRDPAFLQMIQAADFAMTGPDGKTLSKEEDIKNTTSGDIIFDDIAIEDLKVRFYGDTAVATGRGTVKAHEKNRDVSGKYSWTDVFVKMNGEWKAVAAHVTAVAPEKK